MAKLVYQARFHPLFNMLNFGLLNMFSYVHVLPTRIEKKDGILIRTISELELNRLTKVELRQSLWGKMFDWGTVELHSRESKPLVIERLSNPRAFREAVNDAREKYTTLTTG